MIITPFIISQLLIVFAIVTDTIGMHKKEKSDMQLFFSMSAFLISVHFLLLNEYIPALIVFVACIQFLIARKTSSKNWMILFLIITLASSPFLYEHWYSLLAIIASIISVIASFQKKEEYLRIFMMLGTVLWIIHNYFAHTPMGVILDSLFLLNNMWGYYRHYYKKEVMTDV